MPHKHRRVNINTKFDKQHLNKQFQNSRLIKRINYTLVRECNIDYINQGDQEQIAAYIRSYNAYSPVTGTCAGEAADAGTTRDSGEPEKSAKNRGPSAEFCPKRALVVGIEGCLLEKWSKEWPPWESLLAHKLLLG